MHKTIRILLLAGCLAAAGGCAGPDRRAEVFGKTYYLDGAGNWGFGTAEVPRGLKKAGYHGDVEVFIWTTSLNPLIDQLNILGAAEGAGKRLAGKINDYKKRHPGKRVNIIALSAGTGVAVWACEHLETGCEIDHLVLLGSSLSHNYNMTKAMPHIQGNIFVYHSPHDSVLSSVEVVGTIDRKTGVKSVGQVGMKPPGGDHGKVINTPWSKRWESLGWHGGHTDCTKERFVHREIARHIVPTQTAPPAESPQQQDAMRNVASERKQASASPSSRR